MIYVVTSYDLVHDHGRSAKRKIVIKTRSLRKKFICLEEIVEFLHVVKATGSAISFFKKQIFIYDLQKFPKYLRK